MSEYINNDGFWEQMKMYANDFAHAFGNKYLELVKEQNRKLDDLIAAVLTLASVDQRRLHIEQPSESDDVIEQFAIVRELLEGRK